MELGHDWIWLMDDDTLPEPDALAELLSAEPSVPATAAADSRQPGRVERRP